MKHNRTLFGCILLLFINNAFSMDFFIKNVANYTGFLSNAAAKKGHVVGLFNEAGAITFGEQIITEINTLEKNNKIKKEEKLELQENLLGSLFKSLKAYSIMKTSNCGNDSLISFDYHILPILKKIKIATIPKNLRVISSNIKNKLKSELKQQANSWTIFLIETSLDQNIDIKGIFTTQSYGINSLFYLLEKSSPTNDVRKNALAKEYIKNLSFDEYEKPKVKITKLLGQALQSQKYTIQNNEITITKNQNKPIKLLIDYDSIDHLSNLQPNNITSPEIIKKTITCWVKKYSHTFPIKIKNQKEDILTIAATSDYKKFNLCKFRLSEKIKGQIEKFIYNEQEKHKTIPILQLFQNECNYKEIIRIKKTKPKSTTNQKCHKTITSKELTKKSFEVFDKKGEKISDSDKQKIALSILLAAQDKKHIRVKQSK